ncbi:MAG: tRNA (adenosine(37)-N6)-dimethylallyltransferase MiaA [Bacteroidales bacterium]|jgi:tRNA dimethylallyltransferase|nr:tRNA (adenosine(37)-N6)-dimethylallyltransferase MiaA [Bacteroidales bacterium]
MKLQPNENLNLIVILGPTASGKTKIAAQLAANINAEIISADSRQVYRGMDIGTGKDLADFTVGNKTIPYHLIDIVDPGYKYNVFEYQNDFFKVFKSLTEKGEIPILCGGTGMYIDAVLKGYKLVHVPVNESLRKDLDEKSLEELREILSKYKSEHNRSDTDTKKRAIRAIEIQEYYKIHPEISLSIPKIKPIIFGTNISRELRRNRISERLKIRLNEGLIDEAKRLHENGLSIDDMIYYGLEYKFLGMYISGQIDYNSMQAKLEIAIHQFAKRQMTWFRKMEKDGHKIHWIDVNNPMERILEEMENSIKNHQNPKTFK